MARKREVLTPTTPLLCDHITQRNKHCQTTVVSENRQHIKRSISLH